MVEEKKKDNRGFGALFIPAGIFIGMGLGFLLGNFAAWMFLGFGLGFLGFAITFVIKKK
jgi:hypothetical protein